ncbi:DUF2200 family protein [Corynebacterium guangdongense]|uniref:DUF2200 domain-containing protein n=1 Tax=Corynebacterium guangdongense TaxID=1783348 RepID=A0ABU1ZZQ7_9CORY|nr:DUF2200 family protein [Corynebacterium guangdongense]MDR7330412.1 hypothetical protein [Corynebacterium guangdongense]WJZ18970.1 hypothetical protein CGUA_12170 [Corynebacterium guangdongense]
MAELTERQKKNQERLKAMPVAEVWPHYVTKVEKKGRPVADLYEAATWLTGYSAAEIDEHLETRTSFRAFFAAAPMNPAAPLITGVVCGVRVEEIEDPLMQRMRWLDKLVDELGRGKKMESVLRS